MKFMLMIYGNEELWSSFSKEEFERVVGETDSQLAELAASGELVGAYGVADQVMAKMVSTVDGPVVVTDADPYIETKECLASFTIIDVDGLERALEIAAKDPAARIGRHGGASDHARGRTCRTTWVDDARRAARGAKLRRRWRRWSSARWSGAMATSIWPRMRCRRAHARGGDPLAGPTAGRDRDPKAWLITVSRPAAAGRRGLRQREPGEGASLREEAVAQPPAGMRLGGLVPGAPGEDPIGDRDDTLELLFLCCHPALSAASQMALTLRAVGGLTTGEIARAFLVPEPTMGQRISRAKAAIKAAGATFRLPPLAEQPERRTAGSSVLHVLYLMFNEGYTAIGPGPALQRADLAAEAIRLARAVHELLPDDGEVAGLLALMLLTDARRPARTEADGGLVPLAEGDPGPGEVGPKTLIAEGVALVSGAVVGRRAGNPYQLCRRPSPQSTTRPSRTKATELAADRRAVRGAGAHRSRTRWSR